MLTYLSNKSQIIPLTMATRSSAKLLHSKSYAETQKHGGGISILYFTVQRLYSFWALIWSSEEWHQCRVTISLPRVTARSVSGWRKKSSSKSTGRRPLIEEKERHHLHFPPCSAIQLLVFIIVTCSSMCRGQLTLRWREHNNHWHWTLAFQESNE